MRIGLWNTSIVHIAYLGVHVLDALFEGVELLAQGVLVFAQVVRILLDSLEQGLVVAYGLVYRFLVLV